MKKYIRPQIETISLCMEDGLMLSMSKNGNDTVQSNDNWSNKKDNPFGNNSSIWGSMDDKETEE